jgi:hypothetical protein
MRDFPALRLPLLALLLAKLRLSEQRKNLIQQDAENYQQKIHAPGLTLVSALGQPSGACGTRTTTILNPES